MQRFYTIHEFAEKIGVTAQTLRNWDRQGKLRPHHKGESGYRYYTQEQLDKALQRVPDEREVIGYCRVDRPSQRDELEKQVQSVRLYLASQGKPYTIVTDICSGMDGRGRGFQRVLQRLAEGRVQKIVVLYRDRLLELGFDVFEQVAKAHGCSVEVIETGIGKRAAGGLL